MREAIGVYKTAVFFILARMESTAVLYFLRNGVKLHFYSLGTIFEENMRESRGMQSLGSGFPIGARSIPVGTRFCLQSLVCYTFCDRCAGKGLSHARQTLFGGSRTGEFCGLKATKDKEFAMSKIRLFGCSWHRKSCSEAERFSVPTGEQEVYKKPPQRPSPSLVKPPRQLQPYVIQRQLFSGFRSAL